MQHFLYISIMPPVQLVVLCENPECSRTFTTLKGMKSHLRQAKSCSWFLAAGKLPEGATSEAVVEPGDAGDMDFPESSRVIPDGSDTDDEAEDEAGEEDEEEEDDEDPGEVFRQFLEQEELFRFEEIRSLPQLGEAGPGPLTIAERLRLDKMLGSKRRILDDDDDERVEDVHPTAGKVLRMDPTLHERWAKIFGSGKDADGDVSMEDGDVSMEDGEEETDTGYFPFASEMDWRVAQWMVEDGIGHNSFDRLLKIPGVRQFSLILSPC